MLEETVLATFPDTKKTKGSGSVRGDGDLHHPDYMLECKTNNKSEGISISKADLRKGIQQALKVNRRPIFVMKNALGQTWVCVPYMEFINLLEAAKEDDA